MDNQLDRENLATLVFKAMNIRDFSILDPYLSKEVVLDFPGAGRIEGYRKVLIFMKALLRKFPELQFDISDIITEKEKSCIVWTNKGENMDGEPYFNSGISLIHFFRGKIVFISDYFKDTSFLQS